MNQEPQVHLSGVELDCLLSLICQAQPVGLLTIRLLARLGDKLEAAERELPEAERRRSKVRGPVEPAVAADMGTTAAEVPPPLPPRSGGA